MLGKNTPFGLKPVRTMTGTTWSGQLEEFEINPNYDPSGAGLPTNNLYTGDPVSTNAFYGGEILGNSGYLMAAYTVSPGEQDVVVPMVGVFQGCQYTDSKGRPVFSPYWKTNTPIKPGTKVTGLVATDPNLVYQVQISNSDNSANPVWFSATRTLVGASLQDADTGASKALLMMNFGKIDLNPPSQGNDATGISNGYLDLQSVLAAPANTAPRFMVVGLAKIAGNNWSSLDAPAARPPSAQADPDNFNIVEVVCLDHVAKVTPPYRKIANT